MIARISTVGMLALATAIGALSACEDNDSTPPPTPPPVDAATTPTSDAAPADATFEAAARPPFAPQDEPVTCEAGVCAISIVAGDHHFCAMLSDGTVSCWGDDARGALGRATSSDAGVVTDAGVAPAALATATQLSAAGATTCAVDGIGDVWCWGGNDRGQLGASPAAADEEPHPHPTKVALGGAASRVDVGYGSVCARLTTGAIACWGDDRNSQLARPDGGAMPSEPGPASLGADVARTAAGTATLLALTTNGELRSAGAVAGDDGALGGRVSSVSPTATAEPILLPGATSSFAISSPTEGRPPKDQIPGSPPPPPNVHACAVVGGSLYCWGKSERGGMCSGLPDLVLPLPTAAPIRSDGYAQQVAAGGETTCVRFTDGTVQCCGLNESGQLGTGTAGAFAPVLGQAFALEDYTVRISVAQRSVCALTRDGRVLCWGSNEHGELGQGSVDTLPHPTPIEVRVR